MDAPEANRLVASVTPRLGALALYARQWCAAASVDDVVQEAMVRLLLQRPSPADPVLWMFRAVRNAGIDAARAASRRRRRERAVAAMRGGWFDADADSRIDARAAAAALAELSGEDRQIVLLRVWGDLVWAHVAELTGLPLSTVHDRYRRALGQLRDAMEKPCVKKMT